MNDFNFLTDARRLSAILEDTGFTSWGNRLIDCIEKGAVGGEILMCIKFTLSEFITNESDVPRSLLKDVKAYIAKAEELIP